jgi:glutathione S-transferase
MQYSPGGRDIPRLGRNDSMIDLYTWSTPNGRKVSIMLEELGLPYRVVPVNLGAQEQFAAGFTAALAAAFVIWRRRRGPSS